MSFGTSLICFIHENRLHCTCHQSTPIEKPHLRYMYLFFNFPLHRKQHKKNTNWQQQQNYAHSHNCITLTKVKKCIQCWHKDWHRVINHNHFVIFDCPKSLAQMIIIVQCVWMLNIFAPTRAYTEWLISSNEPFEMICCGVFSHSIPSNNELLNISLWLWMLQVISKQLAVLVTSVGQPLSLYLISMTINLYMCRDFTVANASVRLFVWVFLCFSNESTGEEIFKWIYEWTQLITTKSLILIADTSSSGNYKLVYSYEELQLNCRRIV